MPKREAEELVWATNLEIDGVDVSDYPKFVDTYFSAAVWEETGKPLTDQELEDLTGENYDVLNEMAHEHIQGMADYGRD